MSSRDQTVTLEVGDRVRQEINERQFTFGDFTFDRLLGQFVKSPHMFTDASTMNFFPPIPASGPQMYGSRSIKVVKLVVQPSGMYNQQWRRPLVSHMDGHKLNMIESIFDRTKSLDAVSFAQPAYDILKPAATPEAPVNIVNGWETERLRFFLHLLIEDNMGMQTNHYYWGFTEYSDLSLQGSIDPRMVFTINSFNTTKTISTRSPLGVTVYQAPVVSSQMLTTQSNYNGIGDPNKLYSLRPETVADDISSESFKDLGTTFLNGETVISGPTPSQRSNNVPPNYMSRLVKGYYGQLISGEGDNREHMLDQVKETLINESGFRDRFLEWLKDRRVRTGTGLNQMLGMDQFTLADLEALDAGSSMRMQVAQDPTIINNMHHLGQTSDWSQTTIEAQLATIISQSLPSYMSTFQMQRLVLNSTNMNMEGRIVTLIHDFSSVNNGADLTPVLDALKMRLDNEMFVAISQGNSIPYEVDVACDMLGETWVFVSLAGQPKEPFCCPTFCDSLFAPMVTGNEQTLHTLSHDFGRIFSMMEDKINLDSRSSGIMSTSFGGPSLVTPNPSPTPLGQQSFPQPINNPSFGRKDPGF